jgi:hypothetical protein
LKSPWGAGRSWGSHVRPFNFSSQVKLIKSHHKQQTTYYRKPRLDLIRLDSCVDDDGSKDVTELNSTELN